jgi:hypothetical protein
MGTRLSTGLALERRRRLRILAEGVSPGGWRLLALAVSSI